MYIAVSRSSISILVTRFLGVSRSRIRCCCCSLRVWLSQSVVVYSRAAGRCLRCEAMNFSWILIRDFSPPSSVQIASAPPLLCLYLCAQRWESNCCGFFAWRWGCVCSLVSSWGWIRGCRVGVRVAGGVLQSWKMPLLTVLPAYYFICCCCEGGSASRHLKEGAWLRWGLLVFILYALYALPLCPAASRHGLTFVFAASLFLPHALPLSRSFSALSAGACGDNFCRQMAALIRCWLGSWLTEHILCVNSAFTVNC